jgi:hypothetical protein
MKKEKLTFNTTISNYEAQTREHEGQQYLVLPTIMMVEGVHTGSAGPIFYSEQELGSNLESWNGRPVTIDHPNVNGSPVSANLPSQLELRVGYVFNAHMEGRKLRAEAWVNIAQLEERSPETFAIISNRNPLDVSIGVFSDTASESGDWNDEEYQGIANNLRPDHLALLPAARGACSWDDGCGIRTNKHKGGTNVKNDENEIKEILRNAHPHILVNIGEVTETVSILDNAAGYSAILNKLQNMLNRLDSEMYYYFLEEVYADHFIYRTYNRESSEDKYFQRGYTVNEDESITFADAYQEVRRETSFVTVNVNTKLKRTSFNNKSNMKTNATPCSIDSLIKNTASGFTETDKEWLTNLTQEQVDTLANGLKPVEAPAVVTPQVPAAGATEAVVNSETLKNSVQEILKNQSNPVEFIDNFFPSEVARQMKAGLQMYRQNRDGMIDSIVANSDFSKEELETFEDAHLAKIQKSVVVDNASTDYSFQGEPAILANGNASEEVKSMLNL